MAAVEVKKRVHSKMFGNRVTPEFALDDEFQWAGKRVAVRGVVVGDAHVNLTNSWFEAFDGVLDFLGEFKHVIRRTNSAGERRNPVVQDAGLNGAVLSERFTFLAEICFRGCCVKQILQIPEYDGAQFLG